MDVRPIWTDCDEAGDYVVPNVLSPRDLVSRPDIMDETVPHTRLEKTNVLVSDLVRHKPGYKATKDDHRLQISGLESRVIVLPM